MVTATARPDGLPSASGYAAGFTVLAVTAAVAVAASLLVPATRKQA